MEMRFGIEIEFTGVTRLMVVAALEELFGTKAEGRESTAVNEPYTYYRITDESGSVWRVVRDRSIRSEFYVYNKPIDLPFSACQAGVDGVLIKNLEDFKVELVSPVLTAESLPTLYRIVEVIKSLGGIVNESTGVHIHIDAPTSAYELLDLLKRFCREQDAIMEYFKPEEYRLDNYCKKFLPGTVNDILQFDGSKHFLQVEEVVELYQQSIRSCIITNRENPERYYALNLMSIASYGTVEFRFFNASLDVAALESMLNWVADFTYSTSSVCAAI